LGKFTPIDLQSVSQATPKPKAPWRGANRAAIVAALVSVATAATSAPVSASDLYVPLNDGSYLLIPLGFIAFIAFAAVVVVAIAYVSNTPPQQPPSPEEYDQRAAEYRAKSRMLEAEAAYDDSRAKAALKKQEVKDVEDFLRDVRSKPMRR
jgi:hypothetical protein